MKLEEALMRLDEEELFGKAKSIPVEQSEVIKNMATLSNMLKEAIKILSNKETLLCEDAEYIAKIQMDVYDKFGQMLGRIEKYM